MEPGSALTGQEVVFLISKTMSGRIGWKIMAEDENINIRMNREGLEQVMQRIRWVIIIWEISTKTTKMGIAEHEISYN